MSTVEDQAYKIADSMYRRFAGLTGFRETAKAAYQAGREAAARDIRAVRDTRAADACCKGTGECGIDDCRVDSARDDAFTDAADIAEKGATR